MPKLLNFDIAIEPRNGGYRTRVLASPVGEEEGTDFDLPFTDKDIELLVLKVIGSVGRARRKVRRLQSDEMRLLEDFGGQLFQAAFPGRIRECLGRSLLAAESRRAGLRIRLRLPPALANIPWEYLYDREHGRFISLSPETALVRYVQMPVPVRPFAISPPLRILAMIPAPSGVPELQSEDEWRKLRTALDDLTARRIVEADRLQAGTLAALQRPLRLREYHVLHFAGHGVWDENAQDGALALEGTHGSVFRDLRPPFSGRWLPGFHPGLKTSAVVAPGAISPCRPVRPAMKHAVENQPEMPPVSAR
jgi:CHAT domain